MTRSYGLGEALSDKNFARIDAKYGPFVLDAAARFENAKAPMFWDAQDDGLAQRWYSPTWCNPPWVGAAHWVGKALVEADRGVRTVMLLPIEAESMVELMAPMARISYVGKLDFETGAHSCILVFFREDA